MFTESLLLAKQWAKSPDLLESSQPSEVSIILLQMKKLRHRGIRKFAHSYILSKWGRQFRLQDTGSSALFCAAALTKAVFHSWG